MSGNYVTSIKETYKRMRKLSQRRDKGIVKTVEANTVAFFPTEEYRKNFDQIFGRKT